MNRFYYTLDANHASYDADLVTCRTEFDKLYPGNVLSIVYNNDESMALVKVVSMKRLALASAVGVESTNTNADEIIRQKTPAWDSGLLTAQQSVDREAKLQVHRETLGPIF